MIGSPVLHPPRSLAAMETRAALRPGSRLLSLGVWLMVAARALPHAGAVISCASCPSPVQLHRPELQLNPGTAGLRRVRAEFRELGFSSLDAGLDRDHAPRDSTEDEFHREEVPGRDGAALRRAKRSGAEFGDSAWTGGGGGGEGAQVDGQRSVRWNREDGAGINRQDEPKLSSSTFALTGDSAHNHAVVTWSGQNSSVSETSRLLPPLHFVLSMKPL